MNDYFFTDRSVLITGGTGSFGKACVESLLKTRVKRVAVFSRDELKQSEMAVQFPDKRVRFFIGDIRDRDRLKYAFRDVDYVIHAAALKQVPTAEYNPFEVIKTNIYGAQNIIDAAIQMKVKRVIALSSDKACNPVNLYGATKLCSDKLFIAANSYTKGISRFAIVRYGNVIGSRGSIIPKFLKENPIKITDVRMTRFWMPLQKAVNFVLDRLALFYGGEIFIPKMDAAYVQDLAKSIAPDSDIVYIGVRPGEKMDEVLISSDEQNIWRTNIACHQEEFYIVKPSFAYWRDKDMWIETLKMMDGFQYDSLSTITAEGLDRIIKECSNLKKEM